MSKKNKNFMTHRPLSDMHGDGVYFDPRVLAENKRKSSDAEDVQINSK